MNGSQVSLFKSALMEQDGVCRGGGTTHYEHINSDSIFQSLSNIDKHGFGKGGALSHFQQVGGVGGGVHTPGAPLFLPPVYTVY